MPSDAGLRAGEALRLLVEDWNPQERSLFVRSGKGRKDRVTFVAPTTARAIREYHATRPQMAQEDFLFVDARNRPLKMHHLVQILHRRSARARLSSGRRLYPHALRHFAAASWLRNGVGLDQVRRFLGHASLNTTLKYGNLVAADLQATSFLSMWSIQHNWLYHVPGRPQIGATAMSELMGKVISHL